MRKRERQKERKGEREREKLGGNFPQMCRTGTGGEEETC